MVIGLSEVNKMFSSQMLRNDFCLIKALPVKLYVARPQYPSLWKWLKQLSNSGCLVPLNNRNLLLKGHKSRQKTLALQSGGLARG